MTVRGTQIAIGLFNESVFGQIPGSPSGERAYVRTSGLRGNIARIVDDTLSGRRGRQASVDGERDVSGSIAVHLSPQSAPRLLAHAIGTPTTTGAGPYEHVFAVGDGALALPPGLLIEMDLGPSQATNRYIRFHGCRIGQATFRFRPTGFIEVTFDVRGADFSLANTPLDATLDDYGHRAFDAIRGELEEDGAAIGTVQELTVTIGNDLDEDTHVIGGGGVRGELPEGFFTCNGNMTTLYKSGDLLAKAIAGDDTSLTYELMYGTGDGSAGNELFVLEIGHMKLEATTPEVRGPRGLRGEFAFEAHADGTAEIEFSVTIANARASW